MSLHYKSTKELDDDYGHPAKYAARRVLNDYSKQLKTGKSYYLSDTINYLFNSEEDALFTTNDMIIEEIKNMISDEHEVKVTPVTRSFIEKEDEMLDFYEIEIKESPESEPVKMKMVDLEYTHDFEFHDIRLEILPKNND